MDCNSNKNKDCDECQKTLKDHLKKCAGYGQLPPLIEKCEDLPGGCSVGKPDKCACPPPPPKPCPPPPPKCDTPNVCFTCPSGCAEVKDACAPKPDPCAPKPVEDKCCPPPPKCCPPPPTKVQQCGAPKPASGGNCQNDNSCEARPLSMNK